MNATDVLAAPARRALARRRFADFLDLAVPDYQRARHADLLIEHLEALERREIRRLIVAMPPRHSKTLHASQAFPAWYLGRRPSEHVILASYAAELAQQNSRRARGFMMDSSWPFETRVSPESSAVGRWATTSGGGLIASGVGGGLTGFGANLLVVDDPLKDREQADSAAIRDSVWSWWGEVAMTRLQPDAVVLLMATRWHLDDLTGRVLESPGADEWTVLSLPALAGDDDPLGREEGEALWPAWYPAPLLGSLRVDIGERAFQSLYQQAPTPDRGHVIQRDWLEGRYDQLPDRGVTIVQAVDSSFKTGTANDYSVIATWASDRTYYYLVNIWRGKVEFPDLVKQVEAQAAAYKPTSILVEDAASGQSALQVLRAETKLPVVPVKATASKISRIESVSPLFESGKVLLPSQRPSWLEEWVEEHVAFPASKHDDMVDTTSMALERLRSRAGINIGVAPSGPSGPSKWSGFGGGSPGASKWSRF